MRLSAVTDDIDKGETDARPRSLSVDGLVQNTPPLPLLFTSLKPPPDINNLREPFCQRRLLIVFLKPKVCDTRYPFSPNLYSEVNGIHAVRRTYTIALTSFLRMDEPRQYVLYILLCHAKSMEFSNLKQLVSPVDVNETISGMITISKLTGPGPQTFSQGQCNVSAFVRPCSCCLHNKNAVSGNGPEEITL